MESEILPPVVSATIDMSMGNGVRRYRTFCVGDILRKPRTNITWEIISMGRLVELRHIVSPREYVTREIMDHQLMGYKIVSNQDQNA